MQVNLDKYELFQLMKRLYFLLMLFMPFLIKSQTTENGNWWIYFGNKKLDSQWNWHHEVQYRNYNAIGDLEQLLIRTGLVTTSPRITTTSCWVTLIFFRSLIRLEKTE